MQINPLQALQFASQGQQVNSSLRARFWAFWSWLKNTVEARVNIFLLWLLLMVAWRLFWSFAWPTLQFTGPECKNVQNDCTECLTYTYYGANDCRWDETGQQCLEPMLANFTQTQGHTIVSAVGNCNGLASCPAALSGYVPFVCTGWAQFTFFLLIVYVFLWLLNAIQQARFERAVAKRALALAAKMSTLSRMEAKSKKAKEAVYVTCSRCGHKLATDTYPLCLACLYTRLHSAFHWLIVCFAPLLFYIWAVWDPRVDGNVTWVTLIAFIPLGYLLFILLLSFFAMRTVNGEDIAATAEEAAAIPADQLSLSTETQFAKLNEESRSLLQRLRGSDFLDAVLSNLEYAPDAPPPNPASPSPSPPTTQPAPAEQAGIGGFFNKMVGAIKATAEQLTSNAPQERIVEQEQILYIEEYNGLRFNGGGNPRKSRALWIEGLIMLVICWAVFLFGVVTGNAAVAPLVAKGRVVCLLIAATAFFVWATVQIMARTCLIITSRQAIILTRPVSFPYNFCGSPVLTARLPLEICSNAHITAYIQGTWWTPFCMNENPDPPLREGTVTFQVPTDYKGEMEACDYFTFDVPDCSALRLALDRVNLKVEAWDPPTGCCNVTQRMRGLGHIALVLLNILLVGSSVILPVSKLIVFHYHG
jgi:hypothetical protein